MLGEGDKGGDELLVVHCCNCSIMFGITQAQWELLHRLHTLFYCPNGHPQQWNAPPVFDPKDAELKTLREKLTEVSARADKLQAEVEALKLEVEIWRPRTREEIGS